MTMRRRKTAAFQLARQGLSINPRDQIVLTASMPRSQKTKRNPNIPKVNKVAITAIGKMSSCLLRFTLPLCFAFALTGCASIPLMSLPKLMALDMETLDIEKVELAVRLDDSLGISKGSAQLSIKVENEKTKAILAHRLILDVRDEDLTPFLKRKAKPGYKIHRFKLTPEQAEAAQSFRTEALALRDKSGKDLKSELSASVGFCQAKKGTEYEGASLTFYVRTNPNKDFYTLFKEQNVTMSAGREAKLKATAPVYCD